MTFLDKLRPNFFAKERQSNVDSAPKNPRRRGFLKQILGAAMVPTDAALKSLDQKIHPVARSADRILRKFEARSSLNPADLEYVAPVGEFQINSDVDSFRIDFRQTDGQLYTASSADYVYTYNSVDGDFTPQDVVLQGDETTISWASNGRAYRLMEQREGTAESPASVRLSGSQEGQGNIKFAEGLAVAGENPNYSLAPINDNTGFAILGLRPTGETVVRMLGLEEAGGYEEEIVYHEDDTRSLPMDYTEFVIPTELGCSSSQLKSIFRWGEGAAEIVVMHTGEQLHVFKGREYIQSYPLSSSVELSFCRGDKPMLFGCDDSSHDSTMVTGQQTNEQTVPINYFEFSDDVETGEVVLTTSRGVELTTKGGVAEILGALDTIALVRFVSENPSAVAENLITFKLIKYDASGQSTGFDVLSYVDKAFSGEVKSATLTREAGELIVYYVCNGTEGNYIARQHVAAGSI